MKHFLIFILSVLFFGCADAPIKLQASASVNESGFLIKNGDAFDYVKAKIEVNNDFFIENIDIKAGEELVIPFSSLAKDDGERFDVLLVKPLNLSISYMDKDYRFYSAFLSWE